MSVGRLVVGNIAPSCRDFRIGFSRRHAAKFESVTASRVKLEFCRTVCKSTRRYFNRSTVDCHTACRLDSFDAEQVGRLRRFSSERVRLIVGRFRPVFGRYRSLRVSSLVVGNIAPSRRDFRIGFRCRHVGKRQRIASAVDRYRSCTIRNGSARNCYRLVTDCDSTRCLDTFDTDQISRDSSLVFEGVRLVVGALLPIFGCNCGLSVGRLVVGNIAPSCRDFRIGFSRRHAAKFKRVTASRVERE